MPDIITVYCVGHECPTYGNLLHHCESLSIFGATSCTLHRLPHYFRQPEK
ncbi:hypothetical protein [Wielerella bovis]|nr:hypothetical protein [Wielerella bovis]ULJ61129.1 hypothetical protein MIS44_04565 [Wielerella bovis]